MLGRSLQVDHIVRNPLFALFDIRDWESEVISELSPIGLKLAPKAPPRATCALQWERAAWQESLDSMGAISPAKGKEPKKRS